MPTQSGGGGYKVNDWHDKEIQCMVGTLTTANQGNLLDWCRMKIKLKKDKDAKFEKRDNKDGKKTGWSNAGKNDKFQFQDDPGDKQNCKWDDAGTSMNFNSTSGMVFPTISWTKELNTGDQGNDNQLSLASNYTLMTVRKDKDGPEVKSNLGNFYIDDPYNPIITGAKYLLAGAVTTSSLVIATLA